MQDSLEKQLTNEFGPLMGGQDLVKALGYSTLPAFRRACRDGVLGVRVFNLPDRKGKFALTREVAGFITHYVEQQSKDKGGEQEQDAGSKVIM